VTQRERDLTAARSLIDRIERGDAVLTSHERVLAESSFADALAAARAEALASDPVRRFLALPRAVAIRVVIENGGTTWFHALYLSDGETHPPVVAPTPEAAALAALEALDAPGGG